MTHRAFRLFGASLVLAAARSSSGPADPASFAAPCRGCRRHRALVAPLVALAVLLGTAAQAAAQASAPYRELLARLQARDTAIDFTALRLARAASDEYAPYFSPMQRHRDSLPSVAVLPMSLDRSVTDVLGLNPAER